PTLLQLEDRITPAVTILGTPGDDVIRTAIAPEPGTTQFRADVFVNDNLVFSWVNDIWPFPVTSVFAPDEMIFDGLGGNDHIDLPFTRGSVAGQHNTVHGGDGDDTIVGSFGHDEIYGDAGADSLNAGVDEDTLFADTQDVSLVGGGGIDSLVMSGLGGL